MTSSVSYSDLGLPPLLFSLASRNDGFQLKLSGQTMKVDPRLSSLAALVYVLEKQLHRG